MDSSNDQGRAVDLHHSVLTDRQQVATASILAVCMVFMVASWGIRHWRRNRMIDIERPFEPRQVELKIDLNQATWPELTLLPEVGETMARRIVEFREVEGRFETLDELKQVRGIGPRTFDQVQSYLAPIPPIPTTANQTQ